MIWQLGRTAIYFLMGWNGQKAENGPPKLFIQLGGVLDRSKGPCDVFHPWVRWERGQVGI